MLQTVQKNNNSNLHMDRQCKKTTTAIYIWTDSAKKKQQQQFTYGQTDQVESEEDEEDLHCDLSSVFFMLNDLCVSLHLSALVNEQIYWLLPPSTLTEYHINHTERVPPSGGY